LKTFVKWTLAISTILLHFVDNVAKMGAKSTNPLSYQAEER
jgi:hypothetical protein